MRKVRSPLALLAGAAALAALLAGVVSAAPVQRARPRATQTHAKVTAAQAEAVALKRFPGKVVAKTKLENEEGIWQYGVMVRSGTVLREVMVNAKTGKIDSVEVTNTATERKEAQAEAAKAEPSHKTKPGTAAHRQGRRTPPAKTK